MASVSKGSITFDGETFTAASISVGFNTAKDAAQMPVQGSLRSTVKVIVNMHDQTNMPYSVVSKLFEHANVVTNKKFKDLDIELWLDEDKEDVFCKYTGKAWISEFVTDMKPPSDAPGSQGALTSGWEIQDALCLSFEFLMDQENFTSIALSN